MRKTFLRAVSLLLLIACGVAAQTTPAAGPAPAPSAEPVTRRVEGQTLVSDDRPALRIKFDKSFKYAGAQSFILYGVARAEQHFFVDADKQGRVRRLYWVQFEGYLPSNQHTYDYSDTKETVTIGGVNFLTDAVAVNLASVLAQRQDSDGARARAFLETRGYRVAGNDYMWRRMVHFPDASKRDELMIIYLEDMEGTNLTAGDVMGKGSAAARWPGISGQLLKRAVKGIKITRK
jgi:hypothetical protein